MPNLRVQNLGDSLKVLYVDNTDLTRNQRSTYLTEDVVSTGSTIRVQSIVGFESVTTSSGQIVCLGEIGDERTEILRTSDSTGPSSSYKEVTLIDSLAFDHPQDTKVYILDFNRVEFQQAATATGSKITIAAYPFPIQPDRKETEYRDTLETVDRLGQSVAFYFARFNDNIDDRNSSWSDAVQNTGYNDNAVYNIKKRALESVDAEVDGKLITHEFLNESLWEARREYHDSPGKRPFRRRFGVDIGDALTGSYRIELPTDVEAPYTAENIYGVRIGTEANMEHYDKKEFDFDYRNKPHSTTELPYVYNTSTSIWLANGRDFGASAVINIEGINISVTRYEDSLTGDSLYNSLRIHSHPSPGYNTSAGSDAWENISLGLPSKFTVFAEPEGSAYIYFNRPIETAYVNQNIYLDYYRRLVGYDSDGDELDEPRYDFYVNYLAAKIKHRKNRGNSDITQDPDYKVWLFKKSESLSKEYLATDIRIEPDVSHLDIPE